MQLPAPPPITSCDVMAEAVRLKLAITYIALTGFGLGSSLQCDPLPYEIYWNVGEKDPVGINLHDYNIFPANYTQTGNGCSTPGCSPWTQGVFPTISASGQEVNGGVPQNASLSKHHDTLARDVIHWIPNPDWSGNAVLDFEDWTTLWELNTGGGDWHSRRSVRCSLFITTYTTCRLD